MSARSSFEREGRRRYLVWRVKRTFQDTWPWWFVMVSVTAWLWWVLR